jgi:hypothetical protein
MRLISPQGFIHSSSSHTATAVPDGPLVSLPLDSVRPSLDEVSALLPLPLKTILDETRRSLHFFRMDPSKPYYKYRVGDMAEPRILDADNLELWGLSGWFINRLAWRMGWLDKPDIGGYED